MLRIPCPYCGPRDHAEFEYGGDATVLWPPLDAPEEAWVRAVYERDDPRGPHRELWRHTRGCRRWITLDRDTATHAIIRAWPADPADARALDLDPAATTSEMLGDA